MPGSSESASWISGISARVAVAWSEARARREVGGGGEPLDLLRQVGADPIVDVGQGRRQGIDPLGEEGAFGRQIGGQVGGHLLGRHPQLEGEPLAGQQQRRVAAGVGVAHGREDGLDVFAAEAGDEVVGGGVVAGGDHLLGEVAEGEGGAGGLQAHVAVGQAAEFVADGERLRPRRLAGRDLAGELAEDVELEGGADAEGAVRVEGVEGSNPGVGQLGGDEGAARGEFLEGPVEIAQGARRFLRRGRQGDGVEEQIDDPVLVGGVDREPEAPVRAGRGQDRVGAAVGDAAFEAGDAHGAVGREVGAEEAEQILGREGGEEVGG